MIDKDSHSCFINIFRNISKTKSILTTSCMRSIFEFKIFIISTFLKQTQKLEKKEKKKKEKWKKKIKPNHTNHFSLKFTKSWPSLFHSFSKSRFLYTFFEHFKFKKKIKFKYQLLEYERRNVPVWKSDLDRVLRWAPIRMPPAIATIRQPHSSHQSALSAAHQPKNRVISYITWKKNKKRHRMVRTGCCSTNSAISPK